ncbi:hypothetical protein LAJ19_13400 [Deinococcus taeanensis]|uniref:hypothetical protein n=1 Tax=Deinococcus taeanensis TaxID=2737050 RepID=UPI001CDD7ED7|nr:hypothetical protein [Deinococcus taeanensis]UBV42602.1 hypothetical protein LAJ19_13400 [Deinococcus taeanensis]
MSNNRKTFRPIPLEEQTLLHTVTVWQTCRILDDLATHLLDSTFPGWAQQAEPAARMNWTAMCRDLLVDTGELVQAIWTTLEAGGTMRMFTRPLPTHTDLILDFVNATGQQNVQLHLLEVVQAELNRERTLGKGDDAYTFRLLDLLREEYTESEADYGAPSRQGVGEIAQMLSLSWAPNLKAALRQPDVHT